MKPAQAGWRTTDADEIEQRRRRGRQGTFTIASLEPRQRIFGTFSVASRIGVSYTVEIRSLNERINSCDCPDYMINGLGTCKHVEAVLARLVVPDAGGSGRTPRTGSGRVEVFLDQMTGSQQVRLRWPRRVHGEIEDILRPFFGPDGSVLADPAASVPALAQRLEASAPEVRRRIRLSRHLLGWAEDLARRQARLRSRETHLGELTAGTQHLELQRHPLYPYQQEGALFLALTERALLGDEMGLGKTVQAIAACDLLRRLRGVQRVLVVSPVSLKGEWEEQIAKFTDLPSHVVSGPRGSRLQQYREPAFFTLVNYEQVVADGPDIGRLLAPDVVILDEAQRIKNWRTKTAGAVKRLRSQYAFVLTGTPLENRIDDLYSIVQFIDPSVLGPLFRFNREFYELDAHGRPTGYRNLAALRERLQPVFLRRRKAEIEEQLPARTVNTYFVPMDPEQANRTADYSTRVARLLSRARRRPLSPEEFEKLQRWLACMRMLCDTPYILDPDCRVSPKIVELEDILQECLAEEDTKILIFSEWERMLELVRELATRMGIGFAWHTGSVPQLQRRDEIRRFKSDPSCRVFLSSDSGSVGLNLQAASVVINLDLPWNPARLEQRIARAWRKHQQHSVRVIQLVTEGSIEHRMLHVLSGKQVLADGLIDGVGELDSLPIPSGRAAFMERVETIMGPPAGSAAAAPGAVAVNTAPEPTEPLQRLTRLLVTEVGTDLVLLEGLVAPDGRTTLLLVVDRAIDVERRKTQLAAVVRGFGEVGESPPGLEILDRATYEAIERLTAAGIVQLPASDRRVLHASPAFHERNADRARRRLLQARQAFDRAERSHRMAKVLADGGFPVEALPALAKALDDAQRCLARAAGAADAPDGETAPAAIGAVEHAGPPVGTLATTVAALIARVSDTTEAITGPGEAAAAALVADTTEAIRSIEAMLAGDLAEAHR